MLPVDSYDLIETRLQTQHPEYRAAGKRPCQDSSESLYRKVTLMKQLLLSLIFGLLAGSHFAG